jgi:hypothetical protein
MKLTPLMTYSASLNPPQEVGRGPYGTRMIFEVTGGHFEGQKLKGEFLSCGGDWLLVDDNGVGHLDVRATMKTDDGELIYMQYNGVLHLNEKVQAALGAGGTTEYGDTEFFTAPRFETGSDKYQWINGIQAVAEGRITPGPTVEYSVYVLEND